MKYVFGASSHLAFYLCKRIIEVDLLNPDDCIFFFTRNYHFPPKYSQIFKNIINTEYNAGLRKGRVFAGIHFFKTRENINYFDSLVDPYLNGEDFIWYSQVCNNDVCSLFVSKPNCKGYYVIEDGLSSYQNDNPQTFTGWRYIVYKLILKPLCRRCFEVKNHFITSDHPKFKGCIATTEYCFPLHQQCLRCVGLPFETVKLNFSPDAVISIDPLYLWINPHQEDAIFQRLSDFVKRKQYKCLAFKFHPFFFSKDNATIKQRYQQLIYQYYGDDIMEIDSVIGLENVLMSYKSDFYTLSSAVALYAHAMGITVYTYKPIFSEYSSALNTVPIIEEFCIPIN